MKKPVYHIIAWIFFNYFWYRYFIVKDERFIALLLSVITTFFTASTFYIVAGSFVPSVSKKEKFRSFILAGLLFVLLISFLRTVSVLFLYRIFEPGERRFVFMGQYFISLFHISYAFVFAASVRLVIEMHAEQLKLEQERKEKLATELEFLKSQVNPHFLFNIHNSIYFLIRENPLAAEKAMLALSDIMRYQLYDCSKDTVPLESELQNISNYLELEILRAGKKIKVQYEFNAGNKSFLIAPFVLLTLIENAFKHVSHYTDQPNLIEIAGEVKSNQFLLSVVNTVDKKNGDNKAEEGIGLKNLTRRLELIYNTSYELKLSDKNGSFFTHLKLPSL